MLRDYRIKNNLTLEELVEKCEISWRNLQRIENGKYKTAKFETIAKLIKALDINNEDIKKLIDTCD